MAPIVFPLVSVASISSSGQLTVDGATDLNSTLNVDGASTLATLAVLVQSL